MIIKKL